MSKENDWYREQVVCTVANNFTDSVQNRAEDICPLDAQGTAGVPDAREHVTSLVVLQTVSVMRKMELKNTRN